MSATDERRIDDQAVLGATRLVHFAMPDVLDAVDTSTLSWQVTSPVLRGRMSAGVEAVAGYTALAEAACLRLLCGSHRQGAVDVLLCDDPDKAAAQLKPPGNVVERASAGLGPRWSGQ